jgi:hypothetical protein
MCPHGKPVKFPSFQINFGGYRVNQELPFERRESGVRSDGSASPLYSSGMRNFGSNMQTSSRRLARWIVVSVLLVAVFAAAFLVWDYRVKTHGKNDFGSQMVTYTKQGRYEDAIQVGLHALQNQPSDEIIYEGIATIYLVRAQKEPDQREQWVGKAVAYAEKALSLNSRDRDVAGVHLFQDGRTFEVAGDLSTSGRLRLLRASTKDSGGPYSTVARGPSYAGGKKLSARPSTKGK